MGQKIAKLAAAGAFVAAVCLSSTAAFAYGPGQTGGLSGNTSTCTVGTSCSETLSGSGMEPGETVNLQVFSSPIELGTTQADASGNFTATVTLPSSLAAGQHTIVATGETSGTTASFAITVAASTTSATVPSNSTGLAFTGADIGALAGVGALAIALGGLFILSTRRRRSRQVPTR